jgi:hypothetical protein
MRISANWRDGMIQLWVKMHGSNKIHDISNCIGTHTPAARAKGIEGKYVEPSRAGRSLAGLSRCHTFYYPIAWD